MADATVRAAGLAIAVMYASLIGWLYVRQPQSAAEVAGGISASIGAYHVDPQAFERMGWDSSGATSSRRPVRHSHAPIRRSRIHGRSSISRTATTARDGDGSTPT